MEKMESIYRSLFRDISPSVVLVERVGRIDYFCIGSVIFNDEENTYILTQSNVASSSASLIIRFFDGSTQPATVLKEHPEICVLKTKSYHKCKIVDFFKGDVHLSYAATIAPATRSAVYKLPGYIIQESLESQVDDESKNMSDYFTFTCRYGDRSPNGVSRLVSGPVFNLDAQVLGIVLGDMEYRLWPEKENGEKINKKLLYFKTGYFFKMVLCSRGLETILNSMFGGSDWQNGIKQKVQK